MTQYLDATNDVSFKKIFGDKARLQKLLNSIMRLPEELQIKDLEYIPTEQIPDLGQLKRSIVDIKCTDVQGNTYIVEMQNGYADHMLKRVQLYGSRAVANQVKRGRTYADIAPVILVIILHDYKPLDDEELDVITFHRTVEVNTGKCYLKDLSYVFVELDRFNKGENELETFEDQWLYFLANSETIQNPPANLKDEDILSAYEAINQFNWSEKELELYEKAKLAADTEMLNRKHYTAQGEAKGREEGKAEGREEEKIEVAKEMLSDGVPIDKIAKFTKLSLAKIRQLQGE